MTQPATMTTVEMEKIHAEIARLIAETGKINAESRKITRETFWYPLVAASGLVGAVAAITALLIKFL